MPKAVDLMAALKASLEAAKKQAGRRAATAADGWRQ